MKEHPAGVCWPGFAFISFCARRELGPHWRRFEHSFGVFARNILERNEVMGKLRWFLRQLRRAAMVLVLLASLTLNFAFLAGGAVYGAATGVLEAITGTPSLITRQRTEVARLTDNLNVERAANRKLRREVGESIGRLTAQQAAQRAMAADFMRKQAALRSELFEVTKLASVQRRAYRNLAADFRRERVKQRAAAVGSRTARQFVLYRGQASTVGEAVEDTSNRVKRRAATSTGRNVGAMVGEALPFFGTAVIVGVTALEVKDWCDLLKDLHTFEVALDPSKKPSKEQSTVCALPIPTRDELWTTVRESPGRAWAVAREHVPTLEDLRALELPDVDWSGGWIRVEEAAGGAWDATKGVASGGWTATKEGAEVAKEAVGGVVDWWRGDEEATE